MGISDGIEVATIAIGDWIRDWSDDLTDIPSKINIICTTLVVLWMQKTWQKGCCTFRVFVKFAQFLFCFLRRCGVAKSVTTQSYLDMPQFIWKTRKNWRFDGQRATKTTSEGTHTEADTLDRKPLCCEGRKVTLAFRCVPKVFKGLIAAINKIQSSV